MLTIPRAAKEVRVPEQVREVADLEEKRVELLLELLADPLELEHRGLPAREGERRGKGDNRSVCRFT
jgi:hypothetical protein